MNKKVIIACYDSKVRRYLKNAFKDNKVVSDVIECDYPRQILLKVHNSETAPLVFCDKYFYGYKLKDHIKQLKRCNERSRICFCEEKKCSRYFGIRINYLQGDGYIAHAENESHLQEEIAKLMQGQQVFAEEIKDDIRTNLIYVEQKNYTDISDDQYDIAYYLGEGYTQSEIADILHKSENTIHVQVGIIRNKIAYKCPRDFSILNEVEYGMRLNG